MQWVAEVSKAGTYPIVRYEDLALDLAGVARRLEDLLGVDLDPAAVLADTDLHARHATTRPQRTRSAAGSSPFLERRRRSSPPASATSYGCWLRGLDGSRVRHQAPTRSPQRCVNSHRL